MVAVEECDSWRRQLFSASGSCERSGASLHWLGLCGRCHLVFEMRG